jgi:hypothetical protein
VRCHLVRAAAGLRTGRAWGPSLALAVVLAALALLPAAPAAASTRPASVSLPAGGFQTVPAESLDELLGEAELGPSGVPLAALEPSLLTRLLAERAGIDRLSTVNGLGGNTVKHALHQALEEVVSEEELVEELVGEADLAWTFEEKLEEAYEASAAAKQPGAPEFEEAVEQALGASPEEVIIEGLGSITLGELLSELLGEAAQPTRLATDVLAASQQEELEELLGTTPNGEPLTTASAGEVATALGVTPSQLAAKLGKTPMQLPEAARTVLAPMRDGQVLVLFAAGEGLAFALVGEAPPPQEEPEEGEEAPEEVQEEPTPPDEGASTPPAGGSSSPSSNPGTGAGTSASASAASSPTNQGTAQSTPSTPAPAPSRALAPVRILAHKVARGVVTLVVKVPAAGRLTLRGKDLRTVTRTAKAPERLTIRLSASRAGAPALRRHPHQRLTLRATFAPAAGSAPSSASLAFTLA